jgi:hypothetical protein
LYQIPARPVKSYGEKSSDFPGIDWTGALTLFSDMATPPELPKRPKPYDIRQDAGMRMLMPVGRSGWAIAAGYAGLFSFILIGAPFALIFGILGIREIRKSRSTDQPKFGMGRAIFGIVMGALVCLLALWAGISIMLEE